MNRLLRFYHHWSVTSKFVIIYVSILLISLIATGFTLYRQASESAVLQAQTVMEQNLLQTKASIEEKVNMTENISQIIAFDSRIRTFLDSDFINDSFQLQDYRDNIVPIVDNIMRQYSYVHAIHVYMSNQTIPELYGGYDGFYSLHRLQGDPEIHSYLDKSNEQTEWRDMHKERLLLNLPDRSAGTDVFSYQRKIYSARNYGVSGLVEIEITENELLKSLKDSISGQIGSVFMVDDGGRVVSSNIPEKFGIEINRIGLAELPKSVKTNQIMNVQGVKSIVISIPLEGPALRVVGIFPISHVVEKVTHSIRSILIVLTIALLLLSVLVYFVTVKLLSRMKQLLKAMKQVKEGSLDVSVPVFWNDEFSQMAISFNHMTRRIHDLVETVYKAELLEKEAEFKALESQINPHFLYNTLATISWVARKSEAKDVVHLSDSLARFYRLVLNKGSSETWIGNELDMVQAYLAIQKFRFEERFDSIFEVDDQIRDYATIKNILQPLVENALVHGIEPKRSHGTIIIKAYLQDNHVVFQILDDGVGMSWNRIQEVREGVPVNSNSSGYALSNIIKRLRAYYGADHNLELFSKPGVGTVVTLSFPARRRTINVEAADRRG
ncbi:cache domain-containing sensor histidine kinase [Cohnella zeiphila]|uniref:histidine kinase n=1 Tax=Cohnella zeiphila TaxID=2761120 RepID=A0A7X0SQ43_9BACL|nr:sensor histidine kinase [Cohnella zeiphila]MBB6732825.1 sensor histidine kinase [Cohnella zeiphila]